MSVEKVERITCDLCGESAVIDGPTEANRGTWFHIVRSESATHAEREFDVCWGCKSTIARALPRDTEATDD